MIPYQAVIQQLEKQLSGVKNTGDEQQIREALTAIRALCDVVLDTSDGSISKAQSKHLPQMLVSEPMQPSLYTAKIDEEDGANGDSIFDF